MQVYRVARRKFAIDLTGKGARTAGRRWNPKGMAVIYTSEHSALALPRSCAPIGLQLATITIPDEVKIYSPSLEELPGNWDVRLVHTAGQVVGQREEAGGTAFKLRERRD